MIASVPVLWVPHLCEAKVGDRRVDELVTTRPHRFWVTNRDANNDGISGDWIEAEDLRVGDRFLLADGGEAVLKGTESIRHLSEPSRTDPSAQPSTFNLQLFDSCYCTTPDACVFNLQFSILNPRRSRVNLQPSTLNLQLVTTYNFEVADTHTYFVGDVGFWVHNDCEIDYKPRKPKKVVRLLDVGAADGIQSSLIVEYIYRQMQRVKEYRHHRLVVTLSDTDKIVLDRAPKWFQRTFKGRKMNMKLNVQHGDVQRLRKQQPHASFDVITVNYPYFYEALNPLPELVSHRGVVIVTHDFSRLGMDRTIQNILKGQEYGPHAPIFESPIPPYEMSLEPGYISTYFVLKGKTKPQFEGVHRLFEEHIKRKDSKLVRAAR